MPWIMIDGGAANFPDASGRKKVGAKPRKATAAQASAMLK
jgi:hypothetical protein